MSEGLTKIHQGIKKLWINQISILWRHLRAALPLYCVCKSIHLSLFFIVLDKGMGLYHRGIYINIFLMKFLIFFWKNGNLWNLHYTTYGTAARKWRHKIKISIIHNFFIPWWIFFKPSLIFFFYFSVCLQSN